MKNQILLAAALALALTGCTTITSNVPADPSYAADIQSLFNGSCVGCHGSASPSGGYSLTSRTGALGTGSDSIANVIPGNADSSKLYRKVTGIETPRMPLGQTPLDTVKTATIRNWIDKGAKDN